MALRKEIFQKLREKHKNTPKAILDKVADHLEKGVTEETDVDSAADGAEGLVSSFTALFQSEGDRRAAEALKGVNPDDKKGKKGSDDLDDPEAGKDDKDTPAWAKAQSELITKLIGKVDALEQGKTIDTRKQAVLDKLKGVADEAYKQKVMKNFGRMNFEKDEEFDEYLEEVETEASDFVQNLSDQSLGSFKKPAGGGGTTKEASKEEVDNVLDKIV